MSKISKHLLPHGRLLDNLYIVSGYVITIALLFAGTLGVHGNDIKIGDISPKRYVATKSVENRIATERLQSEAQAQVGPLYKHDSQVRLLAETDIRELFTEIDNAIYDMKSKAEARANAINAANSENGDAQSKSVPFQNPQYDYNIQVSLKIPVILSKQQYEAYDSLSRNEKNDFETDVINVIDKAFEQGMTKETLDKVTKEADETLLGYGFSDTLNKMGESIVDASLKPNLILDEEAMDAAKAQKKAEVQPVMVLKDQKIVDSGEVISEEAYNVLLDLGLINTGYSESTVRFVGCAVIIFIACAALYMYIGSLQKKIIEKGNATTVMFFLYLLALAIVFATKRLNSYSMIPLSVFAMLVSILIKPKIAVVVNMFVCIIAAFIFNGDIYFLMYFLLTGTFSSILVQYTKRRSMILMVAVGVGLINMFTYAGINLFSVGYTPEAMIQSLYAGVEGIIAVIMVIGSLPLWEGVFGINTKFTLSELANPNNELMRRLMIETPGTYHHCLIVANLAETAAYDIYANETLAKVGAFFHDIGKLENPQCFSENQYSTNIHDNLDPYISAQMIMAHVENGKKLAEENGLPKAITDIIEQHHGTTLVKYFYMKCAKEKEKTGEPVYERDFRYPGPIPQSKEAAIVMLADTVEAAVRSSVSKGSDPHEVRNLVDVLVKDKLDDGQLNDCRLDLREIETIKNSFMKMFGGMYHHRVSYPKQDEINATRQAEALKTRKEELK